MSHDPLPSSRPPGTAAICDAHMRLGLPLRVAPPGIVPIRHGMRICGPVLAVRHDGSVDAIIDALSRARPGDVVVVANQGRTDEGCVGDLLALEGRNRHVAGFVIDGLHRDHDRLVALELPVFSYGRWPAGPLKARGASSDPIRFGGVPVLDGDHVTADGDGVVFLAAESADSVRARAHEIEDDEHAQARRLAAGESLHDLLDFAAYLRRRAEDPAYDLRTHLRRIGGVIEA
jgi:regulator of RNase E activity RraA